MRSASFNWFEVICQREERNVDPACAERQFEALITKLSVEERKLTVQSHEACLHIEREVMQEERCEASAWNGEIVSRF